MSLAKSSPSGSPRTPSRDSSGTSSKRATRQRKSSTPLSSAFTRSSSRPWLRPKRARCPIRNRPPSACTKPASLSAPRGSHRSARETSMTADAQQQAKQVTFLEAIREALREEMARDERVFVLGEDVGAYGGAFKVTEGLLNEF